MSGKLGNKIRAKIRILRRTQGVSQQDIAAHMGWLQPTVSKYLLGKHNTDIDSLDRLARLFGTSLVEILSDATPNRDEEFESLYASYRRIDATGRRAFRDLVQRLSDLHPRD
jgi:transcriptional regulator with XRE-family HTH domain